MAKPASRTPANESHVLVTASASQPRSPLLPLTKRIADCGCNLVEARLAALGQEVVVSALASGSWDAIAKFEATAARLEREEGMRLQVTRTGARAPESASLPYMIEVVAADKSGVLYELRPHRRVIGVLSADNVRSTIRWAGRRADGFFPEPRPAP